MTDDHTIDSSHEAGIEAALNGTKETGRAYFRPIADLS
jgi:hypothetical protein